MKKIMDALRKIDVRSILLYFIGIVVSRTIFLSMNPIAVGYYAAGYSYKKNRKLLLVSMLVGLASIGNYMIAGKYGIVILCISFIVYLSEKKEAQISRIAISILSGVSIIAITLGFHMEADLHKNLILLAVLEGVLVTIIANILGVAIDFIKNFSFERTLENQELISLSILAGCVVYGMPHFLVYEFSIIEMIAYLLVIFMGYKYGAGAGAVAGVSCGVVLCVQGYTVLVVGVFCILGIAAGIFRELGRFAAVVIFVVADVGLCYYYIPFFLEIVQIRALVSAVVVFLLLPRKFTKLVDLRSNENAVRREKRNFQYMTGEKFSEFSESFQKLSKSFYNLAQARGGLEREEMENVFVKTIERTCGNCKNNQSCWESNCYQMKQMQESVMEAVRQRGHLCKDDFPIEFRQKCRTFPQFLEEMNKEIAIESVNLNWNNRLAESRFAVAGQLNEVAEIIDGFSKDIKDTLVIDEQNSDVMKTFLKACHLDAKKISVIKSNERRSQLSMLLRTRGGRCITTREAAQVVSRAYGKKMKPALDSKNVVTKAYENIQFVEDTNYQVITGMVGISKNGEKVSGDTFSFMNLENGEMVMILSDGMGTGERAQEESARIIELLEQFLEAGFTQKTAIKLINSILVLNSDYHTVSTFDISSINLYTGMCNFIKIGAVDTFIKRDSGIETVQSANLPAGMFNEIDIDKNEKKLYDGDYVIMVSDGILDSLEGTDKEKEFKKILFKVSARNPQEFANEILEAIIGTGSCQVRDDMTILVAGLWEKI